MPDSLRVLIEPEANSGAWNMAVDAVLLETALQTGQATLRWYRWAEPTLSLGHFQAAQDAAIESRFAALPRVRRLSGGGAILHDQEWTYSLTLGSSDSRTVQPSQLYCLVHDAVIEVLNRFGIPARLRGEANQSLDHHFLCFSRGDANDVVVGPHKILGSAQRRRRGAVLQHGALLLRASDFAPEFPGILDLAGVEIDEVRLFEILCEQTAAAIWADRKAGRLDDREIQHARELMERTPVAQGTSVSR